jgi:hypothetical protein
VRASRKTVPKYVAQQRQPKMDVPAVALKAFGSCASLMSFRVQPLSLGVVPTPPLRASGAHVGVGFQPV